MYVKVNIAADCRRTHVGGTARYESIGSLVMITKWNQEEGSNFCLEHSPDGLSNLIVHSKRFSCVWGAFEKKQWRELESFSRPNFFSLFVAYPGNGEVVRGPSCVGWSSHHFMLSKDRCRASSVIRRFSRRRIFISHKNRAKKAKIKQAESSARKEISLLKYFHSFLCRHLHLSWLGSGEGMKECEDKTQMILWHLILFAVVVFIRAVDEAERKNIKVMLDNLHNVRKKLLRWRNFRAARGRNSCRKAKAARNEK